MMPDILTAIFIFIAGVIGFVVLYGFGFSALVAVNGGILVILFALIYLRFLNKSIHGGAGSTPDH